MVRADLEVHLAGNGLSPKAEVFDDEVRSDLEIKSGTCRWVFELKLAGKDDSVEAKLKDAEDQITKRKYSNPDTGYELKRMVLVFLTRRT